MVILETERLLLRRFIPEDLDDLAALYADPEARRFLPLLPRTREQTRLALEYLTRAYESSPCGLWAAVNRESGRFIGRCGLVVQTVDGEDELEIAYMLAGEFRGQGLATEAACALRDYGFQRLGRGRQISIIHPENTASRRVAERTGMRCEREIEFFRAPAVLYSVERDG